MTEKFRVGLSADFRNADGSPTFRDFDLAPLMQDPRVETVFLESESPISARQLEDIDALVLLALRGWLGLLEEVCLQWIQQPDVTREQVVRFVEQSLHAIVATTTASLSVDDTQEA